MPQNKAVILDRDGVINKSAPEHQYVTRWEDFELLPDVPQALKKLKGQGYKIIVASNQRGVARGMMKAEDVELIHTRLNEHLAQFEVQIDAFYYCPHNHGECECRKPAPGMIHQAIKDHDLDPEQTLLIGDADSDLQAAEAAGIQGHKMEKDSSLLKAVEPMLE